MVAWLGWFNVILGLLALSLFIIRRMNKFLYKSKNIHLQKLSRILSKVHPYLGVTMLLIASLHGYLALGTFKMHTGTISWFLLLFMLLSAVIGRKKKLRGWVKIHKTLSMFFVASVLLHLFARDIF